MELPASGGIFGAEATMENNKGNSQGTTSHLWDWINPIRLYNPVVPTGRLVFFWGLAIYPLIVMLLLMTPAIIILMSVSSGPNNSDYLGIVSYLFMLAWVVATVCICRRRLTDLGRSPTWVWLVVLPVVNLGLFLYLLLKPGPSAPRQMA